MSDSKISDLLGLSAPITKLIETVSCALGKIYTPRHSKRMATAKAKEIQQICNAITDNLHLPIKYESNGISIDTTDANALVQRAENRFLFQEMQKQQHIEAIVANAGKNLSMTAEVSETPVNQDWTLRFFDSVANISDGDMQIIWGKILAGEIKMPGTFSLRTLETVKNLCKSEAEYFQRIAPLILQDGATRCLIANSDILDKYGATFEILTSLDDCGLIDTNGFVFQRYKVKQGYQSVFFNGERVLLLYGNEPCEVDVYVLHLTKAGKELLNVIEYTPNNDYFLDVAEDIWNDADKRQFSLKVFEASLVSKDKIQRGKFPLKEYSAE